MYISLFLLVSLARAHSPVEFVQVLVRAEVLGQGARVAHALHCTVHETRVAQVAQSCRAAHRWPCEKKPVAIQQ